MFPLTGRIPIRAELLAISLSGQRRELYPTLAMNNKNSMRLLTSSTKCILLLLCVYMKQHGEGTAIPLIVAGPTGAEDGKWRQGPSGM